MSIAAATAPGRPVPPPVACKQNNSWCNVVEVFGNSAQTPGISIWARQGCTLLPEQGAAVRRWQPAVECSAALCFFLWAGGGQGRPQGNLNPKP